MPSWAVRRRLRLAGLPPGPPEGFCTGDEGELVPIDRVSEFCADRLRRKARLPEFDTPEDPPIITYDLISRRGRAPREKRAVESKKTELVRLRFDFDEMIELTKAARLSGLSAADWIREKVRNALQDAG